jgi:hypothetical protein
MAVSRDVVCYLRETGAEIKLLIVPIRVMAGLVPAIHAVTRLVVFRTPAISLATKCAVF